VKKRRLGDTLKQRRDPGEIHIPALNRLFSDAFTDRYRRDGLIGVRVPELNPNIWRYALRDAARGAMLWFDESDELIAFNIAHHSGTEGWMGPLAVRPDKQETGVGRRIVQTALDWLRGEGVRTIGLETMPRTVDNIGFYSRLGFVPQHLTLTMSCQARRGRLPRDFTRLGALSPEDAHELLELCRFRLDRSAAGYDYTREFALTGELGIGDGLVMYDREEVRAFALWHSAPLAAERQLDDLRVLKLFADAESSLHALLMALEKCAAALGLPHVAVRCQTAYADAYQVLVERGYRVRWTDLRMTLRGFPESVLTGGEVLFSNWEI